MKRYLPFYKIVLLLSVLFYTLSTYWGVRAIVRNRPRHFLGLALEENIPLIPWTVYIYLIAYLFWAVSYLLAVQEEKGKVWQFILADLIGKTVCFELYTLLPTTIPRPEIIGDTFAHTLLRYLYLWDAADNLFPSIHCLMSWLSYIGVRKNTRIPTWYRRFTCIFALAVCVSTLTVKQHVLADVPAGILLAEFGYWLSGKCVNIVRSPTPQNDTSFSM